MPAVRFSAPLIVLEPLNVPSPEKVVVPLHVLPLKVPVYRISSRAKTNCPVNVLDNDRIDKVDVALSAPLVCNAPGKSGLVAKKALIKEVNFRDGFSGDKPCGASCTYDKDAKEFIFEQTAFGNYLCALMITDSRNTEPLSSHQAIFIITSIL